jgi:hypothetical protein
MEQTGQRRPDPRHNDPRHNALSRSHPLRLALICVAVICNVAAPMTSWPLQVRLFGYALVSAAMIVLAVGYVQSGTDGADRKKRLRRASGGGAVAMIAIYLLATRSLSL